ncbi:electron transfer flavoprotein beta subunit/FixA family protein [Carboxylicivirga mesophila]|uniref:Electron transfer flavoprotein beta subunit/FixA family protein n=1 Tax=Carboxylicivirga mesophila TaxID=1166478 RepID=A0ABS5K5Z7_9BACT|nr:electron transfer flavoprotein beta subunit/FixA family protein [Carboxylicivirga mesophila]MBS2210332.1 electron transfer flavoprotein beta subunit/FixA family protein [Carboxylicivirga mesophila]
MKVLVCMSYIPDTTTKIRFREDNTQLDDTTIQWVINPWDELALTRAVELKEDAGTPVDEVEIVMVGGVRCEPILRKGLAIGADKATRIDVEPLDAFQTATQLAAYLQGKDCGFIVCGIESGDYNEAAVGGMLAELLDYASVSSVSSVQFDGVTPIYQRDVANGKEQVKVDGPAVLIVQKGFARVPKIPNMRGIMTARSKPLDVIPAIEVDPLVEFVMYTAPPSKGGVKMLNTPEELVRSLSDEAKLI